MKKLSLALLACAIPFLGKAQSTDYFQQEVNYKIDVTLNDVRQELTATEEFEYVNNSPATLDFLYIHLWPNAYKNSKTALAKQLAKDNNFFLFYTKAENKGMIDSLSFTVDGQKVEYTYYNGQEDIAVLKLPKPLPSGGRIVVKTPFRVKLPSGKISRLGHIGQSYQITQWYPKPAVYDPSGWHPIPYLTQGEFYSEYGSFDVKITLPENYVVGATGDLQTASEIEHLNQLANNLDVPTSNDFPASSAKTKTIEYKQKNVHDFGWFADKRWIVRKGKCILPNTKKEVTTWAMFTPENALVWEKAGLQAIHDGLYYYSKWSGDYPYDQCTAVDGTISAGGGMEYPNVTVIGNAGSESMLKTVIIHEVGHNWFYGILGSNERDHAWMDEGINSFFETRTVMATEDSANAEMDINVAGLDLGKMLGVKDFGYKYLSEEVPFLLSAREGNDQPIDITSDDYSQMNYGVIVYKKTAIAFNYLMGYLGEAKMNECMSAYFDQWKFRHPQPEDIKRVFEDVTGEDLSWFFEDLIETRGNLDFRISTIRHKDGKYTAQVTNVGQFKAPFSVSVLRKGEVISTKWFAPIKPFDNSEVSLDAQPGDNLQVNYEKGFPEYNRRNNNAKTKGVFKLSEPTTLKFFTSLDNQQKNQIFYIPLWGWNAHDKNMVGLNIHNRVVPKRKFQWSLAPMYSLANGGLNGFASVELNMKTVRLGVNAQQFSENAMSAIYAADLSQSNPLLFEKYRKVNLYATINLFAFRNKRDWNGEFRFDYSYIKKYDRWVLGSDVKKGMETNHFIMSPSIKLEKKMTRSKFNLSSRLDLEQLAGSNSRTELKWTFDYLLKKKRKLVLSAFYGASREGGLIKGFSPSGQSGSLDYTYRDLYLGRNSVSGLPSQQIVGGQGAIYAPTGIYANRGLTTFYGEIDLPIKFPIALYGGYTMLLMGGPTQFSTDKDGVKTPVSNQQWAAGVTLPIARGMFQIWMPIVYSSQIQNNVDHNNISFGNSILFEMNLNMYNPFNLVGLIGK